MAGLPLLREPVDPMEGGLSVVAWAALWQQCHATTGMGAWRTEWPDGKSVLEQSSITVDVFGLITSMALEASKDG
jgi:hypothetical protein